MKTIVGNWKMNLGVRESVALARGILRSMRGKEVTPDVVLCPAFTSLGEVHKALSKSRISLGAQNCGTDRAGAFTGEVAIPMLKDVGVSHVIIGHSERRTFLNEDDVIIRKKFRLAIEEDVTPILCVGESKEEREAGRAIDFVKGQLMEVLKGVDVPKNYSPHMTQEPVNVNRQSNGMLTIKPFTAADYAKNGLPDDSPTYVDIFSGATKAYTKSLGQKKIIWPKYYQNPYQFQDYVYLQDIYANTICGRIFDTVVHFSLARGIKPKIKIRHEDQFETPEQKQTFLKDHKWMTDELEE